MLTSHSLSAVLFLHRTSIAAKTATKSGLILTLAILMLLLPNRAAAQTILVDTGAPTNPSAGTSLQSAGSQNCSPQPSCGQSFQFWAGQFTLAHAATISSVQGWMGEIFSGGSITVKLYADGGGVPGTAIFSQTYTVPAFAASASGALIGWFPFAFSSPQPTLAAGTYWVAFEPIAFTGTTGEGFSTNMDGGAPSPLAHYAVWNEVGVLNQFGNGYRPFKTGVESFGMRVLGTNFPDLAFGTVGRTTMSGNTFGFAFSDDNTIGGVGQANIFGAAGDLPAGITLIRASLFPNSLSTGAWSGASICIQSNDGCTQGSGSGRSVVFRTWTNPTNASITFQVNAVLDGAIITTGGTPGSAIGRVYLFDPTQFSDTVNASADPAQFLVNSLPVDQDLTSLFAPTAVLASISQTVNGPVNPVIGVPLQTGLVTVQPGQSITVMFDVTTITPPGNTVDFFSTLAPANVFFTDQNGNPVTNLLAVGPAFATPATPATLALSPTSVSNPAGAAQTLTATATDSNNAPVVGAVVHFTISGGRNAGSSAPAVTDSNGLASFTYTDAAGAGTDTVQAAIGALSSNQAQVSWTSPGPLDHITINPSASTIAPGGTQSYTAQGIDVFGNSVGDVTAATVFSISPDGSCNAASCTATNTGAHTVTGNDNGKTVQATLQVGGKLDDTTSVTSNPNSSVVGQSVTFTATVRASGGMPTGTVTFKDGSTTLASGVALSGGMATFTTSSLSIGTHTITAVYSGDSNFNGTGAGSSTATALTQQVQYAVCLLYDPTRAVKGGAIYPLKLMLCDVSGNDLSSPSIVVHATSVFMASAYSGAPEAAGNANPDSDFRFDPTLGSSGGYIFNLSTNSLAGGTYGFTFTAGNDPTIHTVLPGFGVK